MSERIRPSVAVLLTLFVVALAALPVAADEMTVEQIIAKNIESKGGQEAWDEIESAKITGNLNMGGAMTMPMTLYFMRPGKLRMEMEMQGNKIIQAYDGEVGWQVMPMMGKTEPQKMSEAEIKQVKRQADFEGPLFNWKDKGHQVELVGKEEIEGTEAYKLKVTLDTGDVAYMYLDTEYFLEFKQTGKAEMQGQEFETDVSIGDYKEVGDIVFAHSVNMTPEGAPAGVAITFDSVELNPEGVDAEFFAMPEVEVPAPAGE